MSRSPAGLARAVALVRARGAAAQLHVIRDGAIELDLALHCGPQSLFWIFSASKPFTAVAVYQLVDQGLITLDDPVCQHWPEFGKPGVTVRHVLRHRSGLPTAGHDLTETLAMTDWSRSIRRLERARLVLAPGDGPAYGYLSYGFILGELVHRVTGVSIQDSVTADVLAPLGLTDTYLGLPDDVWPRHVPMSATGFPGVVVATAVNRRATRRAVIPAAGISTTARDLAGFYAALLADDGRLVSRQSLAAARTPTSDVAYDRYARAWIRWGQGFQLGGPRAAEAAIAPMGRLSSPRTFGHNGSNCCIGWADPDRGLVVAYLTNRLTSRRADVAHLAAVADALLAT